MLRRYPTLRTFRAVYISSDCQNLSDQDLCCICLAKYDNKSHQPVSVTSNTECEHVFGRHCLDAWLDSTRPNRNTCPICRRTWYTHSPTSVPSPRDTNTSQVLEPPAHARRSERGRSEARVRLRATLQAHAHFQATQNVDVARRVEELATSVEALETLERSGGPPLDQTVRVRIHQVQDRLRTFLERNTPTMETSPSPIVRHSLSSRRETPHITERDTRSVPDPISAEFHQTQPPTPVPHTRFETSPLTAHSLLPTDPRSSQQNNQQQANMPRRSRTSSPPAPSIRSTRNPTIRRRSRHTLSASAEGGGSSTSTRLNALTPSSLIPAPTQRSNPEGIYRSHLPHYSLPNIAELEANPPRLRPLPLGQHTPSPSPSPSLSPSPFIPAQPTFPLSRPNEVLPRRTHSTRGFAHAAQTETPGAMTQSNYGSATMYRRRTAEGAFQGVVARVMSLGSLRGFGAGRERGR